MLTMKTHSAMNHPDTFVNLKNKNISRDYIKSRAKKTNDENEQVNNAKQMNESIVSCQNSHTQMPQQGSNNNNDRPMSGMGRPTSRLSRPMSVKSVLRNTSPLRPTSASVKSVLRQINTSPNRPTSPVTTVKFDFDDITKVNEYHHQFKNVDKKINKINNWAANQELLYTNNIQ